jgi:hypothetical protein
VRSDQTAEIAWHLRAIGGVRSDLKTDGDVLVYRAWVHGGYNANGTDLMATGGSLEAAVQALWHGLTAPGAYVMISGSKYMFHRGTFQQIFE